MPMSDDKLLAFLRRPVTEQPVEQVISKMRGAGLAAYLTSVVYRNWAFGYEELESRRDLMRDPKCVEHPAYKALKALESYAESLERHLAADERQTLRRTFSARVQRYSDDWRKREGYLTDDEWAKLYAKVGERIYVGGVAGPITRQEAAALLADERTPVESPRAA